MTVSLHSLRCPRTPQSPLLPSSGNDRRPTTNCPAEESRGMTEPSCKIVATPMVARACGHQQEFQHYAVDKYRAQRLAKFQRTRCAECVAKLRAEQQRAAEAVLTKSEALKRLPAGTQVSLTRQADGSWA